MASRLMHLYVGKLLADKLDIQDKNRFLCGILLPDAYLSGDKTDYNTHYVNLSNDHKTMDFGKFFEEYKEKILTDELYLGYYLHLVQDCAYRQFIYYALDLLKLRGNPDFLDKLYADFHSLNAYIYDKAGKFTLTVPDNFENEEINKLCPFQLEEFFTKLENDYLDTPASEHNYISPKICEEYFTRCLKSCIEEYENIKADKIPNAWKYCWRNQLTM